MSDNDQEYIEIYGAKEHNLKNINLKIPKNQLVVFTGVSGSGKSSLAFDTIYAEGQRRFLDTLGSYFRNFIGNGLRPDVEKIDGLSPVIAIDQKTVSKNPRSTVGTITEVYDFLRLLFSKISKAYSYNTGELMRQFSEEKIIKDIYERFNNKNIIILAPVIRERKGAYRDLFINFMRKGFFEAYVDGNIIELSSSTKLEPHKIHNIEIVIDDLDISYEDNQRIAASIKTAFSLSKDAINIMHNGNITTYSKILMCPTTGVSYETPEPSSFSFNSPKGACPYCKGLGYKMQTNEDILVPDKNLSINQGAIEAIKTRTDNSLEKQIINFFSQKYNFSLDEPYKNLPEEVRKIILEGFDHPIEVPIHKNYNNKSSYDTIEYKGLINYILSRTSDSNETAQDIYTKYLDIIVCHVCKGARLKKESLSFKVLGKNIYELANLTIEELYVWFDNIYDNLDSNEKKIAEEIIKEVKLRLKFMLDVGLSYLSLSRSSTTISGGEAQRIRLATQLGSQLVNVLYILDEPSIGLHQRDNTLLIDSLKKLRDLGNTVLVVEHDRDMILEADYIVDIGPKAGVHGGEIIASGDKDDILKSGTLTAKYLNKELVVAKESIRNDIKDLKKISLKGANGHNLKNASRDIPLGAFTCVTGVSGSGKSTLINGTLYPILSNYFYRSKQKPLPYESITGLDYINKVIQIDQSPIGRLSYRSNPSTYTGLFTDIRIFFSQLLESKIRSYTPGHFSFNIKGGRCEECKGAGVRTIEMKLMPDVTVICDVCNGKRYNDETLEIKYKGKSISDILYMDIDQACELFANQPHILNKLKTLNDLGLGYLKLGQSSSTLSGGEAQRIKLATELSKKSTGKTLYILDEPTTGLHFEDIKILLELIQQLVAVGNTVLMIEHNIEVIESADYLIDIGPEAGNRGGCVIYQGEPRGLGKVPNSYTGKFLFK
ncbi:MAG: excinuclease ABC subunit UvrA [Solitalea-like symbiont of Acarus siro]